VTADEGSAPLSAHDYHDPIRWAERRWWRAINDWLDGDGTTLAAHLRDPNVALTADAREFLAALALGEVKKGEGGKPKERHAWLERSIAEAVFAEWDRIKAEPKVKHNETPKARAVAIVAERKKLSDGQVLGVVNGVQKAGYTLKVWQQWVRPDFKKSNR